MTVRISLKVNRQRVQAWALLVGITLPLLAAAALLPPTAPKSFDFNDFERERALARTDRQRGQRVEARAEAAPAPVRDLDKHINGTLVVFGLIEGTRR